MRILYDVVRDGLTSINQAADELAAARAQVSSGRRITTASDDPIGAQQAVGEHATLGAIDAYSRSRDAAAARLAAADSLLSSFGDKLTAAIVAGLGARGSAVSASARAAASAAVAGLRESLLADINSDFNGTYLFSGTRSDTPAYALVGGVWTYQGDASATQVEVERGRLVSVTFDGRQIAQGDDADNVFAVLDALVAAIDAGDDAAIGDATAALERALDRALRAQGRLGADERGVDDAAIRLSTLRRAADTRRSALEDVNLADAITRMADAETAYRAALGAVSSAERLSLLDYLR
jgi:flagellar hook-associated protein 3 FlgL